jgi:ketosteroid isomerase-like protein
MRGSLGSAKTIRISHPPAGSQSSYTRAMRLTRLALAGAVVALPAAPAANGGERPLPEEERRAIVRTLESLEEQWIGVYVTHDLSVLERILAPDFVATLSDGEMRGKREHIAAYPADFEAFASVVATETKVRVYTPDVAVVTGLYTAQVRRPEGKEPSGRYRFTDVWALRAGAWQCVATQETRVP